MMKLVSVELQWRLAWNGGIDGFHDVVMVQVFFRSLSVVELIHSPMTQTCDLHIRGSSIVAQNM
jgi:hypothetical protein